ncbi:D-alanyl-D-alanine carboxypeptidase family protein [Streptomyces sp. PsTaAH-124]|uniref:D-alanyl-D-alanine carboxypeptidase family protein n=1 Tax=Streptomyces sp. PsTaAH-124 TaxID=1157638 RepID=UPI00035F8FF0|nr:serine hydrolase [Streptomyces sp. PsTaAH-124]
MCPVTVPGEPDLRPVGPPPATGRRRFGAACAAGATALAALVVLAVVTRGGDGIQDAGSAGPADRASTTASLPWPGEGQTSVSVEGVGPVGDLGTRGAQKPVPIASVTKVMTAYVVLRGHPLDEHGTGPGITVDEQAADESVSGSESTTRVDEGRRLDERRLLELMLIPSGNNIARLLARWDAGTEEAFVAKMNEAARDLGMRDTTYTDASGIGPTNTSTSEDQLKLARAAMRQAAIRSVVAMRSTSVPGVPGEIKNTNTLLGEHAVIGLKTGSSTPAGGNLMWAATAPDRDGHERLVLGVVLHQRTGEGSSPQQSLETAISASGTLVAGVREWVAANVPGKR